jgi:hypothetical protein
MKLASWFMQPCLINALWTIFTVLSYGDWEEDECQLGQRIGNVEEVLLGGWKWNQQGEEARCSSL